MEESESCFFSQKKLLKRQIANGHCQREGKICKDKRFNKKIVFFNNIYKIILLFESNNLFYIEFIDFLRPVNRPQSRIKSENTELYAYKCFK